MIGHRRSTGGGQVVKPASAEESLSRAMTVAIEMGHTTAGAPATLDLEELLATRLLVQGNSGSGKSHLLRRLLEQSAPWVRSRPSSTPKATSWRLPIVSATS